MIEPKSSWNGHFWERVEDEELDEDDPRAIFEDGFRAGWDAFKAYVAEAHPTGLAGLSPAGTDLRWMRAFQEAKKGRFKVNY